MPSCFINIGGITNLTYYDNDNLNGYDIGPGNVLMDEFSNLHFNLKFDENGAIASSGKVVHDIVNSFLFFKSF